MKKLHQALIHEEYGTISAQKNRCGAGDADSGRDTRRDLLALRGAPRSSGRSAAGPAV
ncbi:MAG TPA: hypothetical protein VGJ57_04495 [Nitrospirales bacterium]